MARSLLQKPHISRNKILVLLLAIALLYVLLPQIKLFHNSLTYLLNVHIKYIILMSLFTLMTFFFAALTYCFLSLKRLSYPRTLLMQFASMLTNKLLPAGIGGIGLNYIYLRKNKLSKSEAVSVVASNNFLGLVGHVILFLLILLIFHPAISNFHIDHSILSKHKFLDAAAVLAAGITIIALLHYANKIRELIHGIIDQFSKLGRHPLRLFGALSSSMCLTLSNIICLYVATTAVAAHVSFMDVLITFTLGILVSSATPTPGGLGGMEAGLLAALVSYRVAYSDALAAVLLYRLISYWFTLILGAVAFLFAEQNNIF